MQTLENLNLTGQFLIAMPSMTDPHFSETITFICTHNEDGVMGIILNRPSEYNIASLFEQVKLEPLASPLLQDDLYIGGPRPARSWVYLTYTYK